MEVLSKKMSQPFALHYIYSNSPELTWLTQMLGPQCLSFLQSCRYARLSIMNLSEEHGEGAGRSYSYISVSVSNYLE